MKIEIRNRWNNEIILCGEYDSIKDCVEKNRGVNLQDAYLLGAYLRNTNLQDAYLRGADLQGADLRGAYLRGAYLRDADLRGTYLQGADLRGAYLRGAYLRNVYLQGVDLRGADLQGAKNYFNSHDFLQEIIRKQKVDIFTGKEWACIGQVIIHRLCYKSIKKRFGEVGASMFDKLAKAGFGEYAENYKKKYPR